MVVFIVFFNLFTINKQLQDFNNKILIAEKNFKLSAQILLIKNGKYLYNNYNFTHHYDHQRQYIKIVNDIKIINKENLKNITAKINKNIFKINEIKIFTFQWI